MTDLLGGVSSQQLPNGIIRYYGGNAKTEDAAKKLLETARKNGYPDAFIVKLKDGKRLE